MDDKFMWLAVALGWVVIATITQFYLMLRAHDALAKQVTALEDENAPLKERVASLERERDVRTLRRVVDRATAFRDENDGRPN